MKTALIACAAILIAVSASHAMPVGTQAPTIQAEQLEHGGGCRKSSPPGQCCHMDRKRGFVHCH